MRKIVIILLLQCMAISISAQSDKEIALAKAKEAIKIMDEGKIDESIAMLEESKKLDKKNFLYPYEIAYAHVLKKDYETAIKILEKTKKYKTINSQVYQLSGNCYSYLGRPDDAIKEYEEGMNLFPNAGNLHLEKGNIFLDQEKYVEAINNYEKGVEVDPNFPSNYFRLAKLFLQSTDKLSGLIYGEIFMNLERTSPGTKEMSKLLFDTYKSSITLGENESEIDFCEIIIDAADLQADGEFKLPFCAIFGKNFIMTIFDEKTVNLATLSSMRKKFLDSYYQADYKTHPNVLLQYQKDMMDKGLFEAYNHYLFQMGSEDEFDNWVENNQNKYEEFVEWYTADKNGIAITDKNKFIR